MSLSGGKFRLAGPSLLATHLLDAAALPKGFATAIVSGTLELSSWNNATGSPRLSPGASYCVGAGGRLIRGNTGQVIGTAISATALNVSVSPTISRAYDVVSFDTGSVSVGPLNVGIGHPTGGEGRLGEYRIDLQALMIYGPKTDYGWGFGRPINQTKGVTRDVSVVEDLTGAYWLFSFVNGLLASLTHHAAPSASVVIDDGTGQFWTLAATPAPDPRLYTVSTSGPATPDVVIDDGAGTFWKIVVRASDGLRGAELTTGPATDPVVLADGSGGSWQIIVRTDGELGLQAV